MAFGAVPSGAAWAVDLKDNVSIDIPPQPLESALLDLSNQGHLQLVIATGSLPAKVTAGLSGRMSLADALKLLLADTGLEYRLVGDHTIAVFKSPKSTDRPGNSHSTTSTSEQSVSDAPFDDHDVKQKVTRGGILARIASFFGGCASAGGVSPPCAHLTASAQSPDTGGQGIEEIIVTAARQEQNLQKVSAAVSVVPGSELTAQGLTNIADIVQSLPSIQATGQPGGFSIDIRGQGGDLPAGTQQGSVALEFDGIYNINSLGATVGFFDVDRIEILPGPQSTRYGPNADGGVVNVVTKDPMIGSSSGSASFTIGDYGLFRMQSAQNIPLGDTLAARFAVATINRNSYFTPAEGDSVGQSGRAKLIFKPGERLSFKVEYQLDHVGGTGQGSNVFPVFTDKVAPYATGSLNDVHNPWANPETSSTGFTDGEDRANIYQQTIVVGVNYGMNDWSTLDITASHINLHGDQTAILPKWPPTCANGPANLPLCNVPNNWGPWTTDLSGFATVPVHVSEFAPFRQNSEEVRLHNTPGSSFLWNLGFYRWNYSWQYYWDNDSIPGPIGGYADGTNTDAVFGELTYPITDQFRAIAGLRQSFDKRSANFGPNGSTLTPTQSDDFRHFDYRAGLEYDLTPSSMEYVTIASGYRPGGLNSQSGGAVSSFNNEVNTAFELGSKNRFVNNTLQVNADVFYYRQKGYQDLDKYSGGGDQVVMNGLPIICTTANVLLYAACQTPTFGLNARSLGAEAQITYKLTPADTLNAQIAALDAHFNDHQPGPCAQLGAPTTAGCFDGYNPEYGPSGANLLFYNIDGKVEPHSPKFSATLKYDRAFHLALGAMLEIGVNVFYTSGYWLNPVEDELRFGWQPAFWQEGASASYVFADNDWMLNAYAHNLSNYAVKTSVLPATSIGPPRTVGLVISKRW